MHRRLLTLLVQATVVVALVVGTTAFVRSDKTVTLSLDGRQRTVTTYARTVGDALAAEGIHVDSHDLVSPMPDQRLSDGDTVVVRYGRPVVLTVDGVTRSVWTTARDVNEALLMLGVRNEGAYVSASRSRRISRTGTTLDVRLPHAMTFLVDGHRREVTTTAITIRSAMADAGIQLRARDRITPSLETRPSDEQVIGITRVDGKRVVEEKPIAFRTIERKSKALFVGTRTVVTKGKVGIRVRTLRETYLDRRLAERTTVAEHVATAPVTQVVLVGTKKLPSNAPTADGLNWAALANCEAGGNPQAYNPAGPFYGLYQFMESTWHAVGGVGLPTQASPSEQTYRAQILYRRSGAGQWPVCGHFLFS
ncbi:MAG: resuscitation-promoting factor RpfB [Actinomycetota bacterium]|nr:resuscitation-promoting factor RpfB [Actinomycetota bacterium]